MQSGKWTEAVYLIHAGRRRDPFDKRRGEKDRSRRAFVFFLRCRGIESGKSDSDY